MDDFDRLLRERFRADPAAVPAAVDTAILGAGHHAADAFRRRRRFRLLAGSAAAAAAALLVAVVLQTSRSDDPGGFDIADAWRVARGLATDDTDAARFDLTGDGVLDAADADRMLTELVRLAPRRPS